MKKINKCVKLILLVICIALICPIITNANVEEDYNFLYESNDREGNGFFWEASTKTLTITDLNDSNATLYLPYDATIDIEGNKQNTVSAIFARDLTVKGNNTASLNVVGYYENTASPAKSSIYVSRCFVMESGNLTINNPLKIKLTIGIDSHQSIEINGGNLEIHTYNVTMAAPPNDPIYINGGTITGYVDSTGEGVFNQSNFSINENYKCKILYNQTSNSDTTNVKETNKNEISNVYNSKYLKIVPYEDEGIVDKDAIKINNVSVDKSEVEFGDCIKVTFDITSKNDLELGNCSFFEIDTTEKYIQSFKKRFYLEKVNNNQYTCEIPISKEDYAETEFGLTRVCLTDVKGNILDTTNFNECKFNVITHVDENAIVIKDRNLKNAILNLVDKNHNDNISKEEILLLDKLDCTSKYIGDLTGIEYAQNLSELTIDNNHIKDFTPLKQLKMLKKLSIRNNAIKDISTICELSSLTYLDVAKNSITNIDDIVKLSNLTYINISNNSISNINVLHNCSKLTNINASFNKIESLGSLLYTLQKLNVLDISNNNITEIPRIGRTVNLEVLLAEENKISNIDGIKEMPKLYQLDLSDNQIKDLSVFNQYVSTTLKDKLNLDLSYNKIKDISPLSKKYLMIRLHQIILMVLM